MNLDKRLIDVLLAIPGWQGPVFNGYAPQGSERKPTAVPFTVVQQASSEFVNTTCGTDLGLAFAQIEVIYVAQNLDEAGAMADLARPALVLCPDRPGLETEIPGYDPELRAWAVTQTFRASYRPNNGATP